jgi:Ca2+-binding EF-hand superfamily protein
MGACTTKDTRNHIRRNHLKHMQEKDEHVKQTLDEIFDKYDQDHNGELTKEELTLLVKETWQKKYGRDPSEDEVEDSVAAMMSKADKNKSGTIDRAEFIKFYKDK